MKKEALNNSNTRAVYDFHNNRGIVGHKGNIYIVNKPIEEVQALIGSGSIKAMEKDSFCVYLFFFIEVLIIASSISLFFILDRYVQNVDKNFGISSIVLLLNVVLHEVGHAICLIFYKEKPSKIGLTMIFIYPAFYVRTSNSYFLSKFRRINVYLSGLFMNGVYVLFSIIIYLFTKNSLLLSSLNIVVATMLFNMIPIVRTDVYYVLQALASKYTLKKDVPWYDSFIRGGITFFIFWVLFYR